MKIVSLLIASVFLTTAAHAELVHLKNGKTVSGTILEKSNKSIKIESNGVAMTYFADEVLDIDGAPMGEAVSAQPAMAPTSTEAAGSQGKKELILKFIDVFGTKSAMTQNLAAMVKSLPADNPQTQKIKDGINVDEIIERLIPIYDKQFSEEDLNAFIAFYSSSTGRKLVEGIPVIMRDSIAVSGQYFQEKFPEVKEDTLQENK